MVKLEKKTALITDLINVTSVHEELPGAGSAITEQQGGGILIMSTDQRM